MASPARPVPPVPADSGNPVSSDHGGPHRAGFRGEPGDSARRPPLWLAIHLPWLAGEVLHPDTGQPRAVSEESRRGWLVYRASREARERGVVPGLTVSAASVVCPDLSVRPRRPRRERRRLKAVADRLLRFSPLVSSRAPETVLVEVRGSLGLFGGVERLRALIDEEMRAAGHVYRLAGAPVPAAARRLALWGRAQVVTDRSGLRSALGAMPVDLLGLDDKTTGRLRRAGLRTLRDLWRLPPGGLARRFGTALVRELDRLQGRCPDPQPLHASPRRFSAALMLDWATDDLEQIDRAVDDLLEQWVTELRRSARAAGGFTIECLPERGAKALRVEVGLRRLSRDKAHLHRLAMERLGRVRLEGPVAGVVLSSDRLYPFSGRSGQLFDGAAERADEAAAQWQRSEEMLAMRLGKGLDTLHALAEYRPERAWRAVSPDTRRHESAIGGAHRPLWLLDPPRPLPWPPGVTRQRDRPDLVRGPERIETGWWDRDDQRRDYYSAVDRLGRRLWVFWDLRREQWYLHGLFA